MCLEMKNGKSNGWEMLLVLITNGFVCCVLIEVLLIRFALRKGSL